MLILSSYVTEMQIIMVYSQLDNHKDSWCSLSGVSYRAGEAFSETRFSYWDIRELENHLAVLVLRKSVISLSTLGKGLLSPEQLGVLSEMLLRRHEELMGDRFRIQLIIADIQDFSST